MRERERERERERSCGGRRVANLPEDTELLSETLTLACQGDTSALGIAVSYFYE